MSSPIRKNPDGSVSLWYVAGETPRYYYATKLEAEVAARNAGKTYSWVYCKTHSWVYSERFYSIYEGD